MPVVLKYAELTYTDLQQIDPRKAICLITVSPLEVHGPHLPLGTDVLVGEKLIQEYSRALEKRHPDYRLLQLPSIYAGCDPVPWRGSITIKARTLERLLNDYVRSLAGQGFRYLLIGDNHGGPSHQVAIEAARRAWRRYRFALINPFNVVFYKMISHDEHFLKLVGLSPDNCGDGADCHAGTNESSLMLAARPDLVREYRSVPPSVLPAPRGVAVLVSGLGRTLGKFGFGQTRVELEHLAGLLAWTTTPDLPPYLGAPCLATPEAGARMLRGHVAVAMELVDQALAGRMPNTRPMLWWARWFRR